MNDIKDVAEDKKIDILDEIKQIERQAKRHILFKSMTELKKIAKDIRKLKYTTNAILKEIGIEEEDVKRLIDFLSESSESIMSESDKKEIDTMVKRDIEKVKRGFVEEASKQPDYHYATLTTTGKNKGIAYYSSPATKDAIWMAPSTTSSAFTISDANGKSVDLKI